MALHSRRTFLAAAATTVSTAGCLADPRTEEEAPGSQSPGAPASPSGAGGATTPEQVSRPTIDVVDGDWPLPRHDPAGTRFDPEGTVPTSRPGVAWRGEYGGEWGTLAVAHGTLFVVDEPALVAFDAATGERRWATDLDAADGVAGPAVGGGGAANGGTRQAGGDALYIGVDDEVRALSPTDGSPLWSVSLDGHTARRVVPVGGTVYATTRAQDGTPGAVHALADGERRWTFRTTDRSVYRFGSLAVAGDAVYAVGESSASATWHFAVDRATGEQRWQTSGLNHSTALTVVGDAVLVGDFYGYVVAQDAGDGTKRWERELRPAVRQICAAPDGAYAASSADEPDAVAALSLADGATRWTAAGSSVAGAGDGLVVATDGNLHGVDRASGGTLWKRPVGADVRGLAVADGVVFVADEAGGVRALTA